MRPRRAAALALAAASLAVRSSAQVGHRTVACFDANRNEVPCGQAAPAASGPSAAPGAPAVQPGAFLQQGLDDLTRRAAEEGRKADQEREQNLLEQSRATADADLAAQQADEGRKSRLRSGKYHPASSRSLSPKKSFKVSIGGVDMTIQDAEGAFIFRDGKQVPLSDGALSPGDQICTGPEGHVRVVLDEGSRLELGPNTAFTPDPEMKDGTKGFPELFRGQLHYLHDAVQRGAERLFPRIQTQSVLVGVQGTEYDLIAGESEPDRLAVLSGSLSVRVPHRVAWARAFPAEKRIPIDGGSYAEVSDPSALRTEGEPGRRRLVLTNGWGLFYAASSTGTAGGFILRTPDTAATPSARTEFEVYVASGRAIYAPRSGTIVVRAAVP